MQRMLELNTLGPLRLTRQVLEGMLTKGSGHIVVVSSMAAVVPAPGQATYAATKCALTGYYLTLLSELCDRCVVSLLLYPPRNTSHLPIVCMCGQQ